MRIYAVIAILSIMLAGCATNPPTSTKFPAPPEKLMVAPPPLTLLSPMVKKDNANSDNSADSGISLSDATKVIVNNNTKYHLTAETLVLLQEWIRTQQGIYNK